MNVISWLGSYYVDCEIYDQAIQFFERAAMLQPQDSKWPLLIASCYRKNGNYQTAFECYKFVNEKFPDNAVCLKFLVRICTDLGIKDLAAEYSVKLEKLNTGVSNGLTGVEYSFDKVDTTPSHATRNISSKKNLVADEDWNEDVQELLPF